MRGIIHGATVIVAGLVTAGCSIWAWPATELGSLMLTRKLVVDHAISAVTGKDCAVTRWESGLSYCREDARRPAGEPACYRTLADPDCFVEPLPPREAGRQIGVAAPYNVVVEPVPAAPAFPPPPSPGS